MMRSEMASWPHPAQSVDLAALVVDEVQPDAVDVLRLAIVPYAGAGDGGDVHCLLRPPSCAITSSVTNARVDRQPAVVRMLRSFAPAFRRQFQLASAGHLAVAVLFDDVDAVVLLEEFDRSLVKGYARSR